MSTALLVVDVQNDFCEGGSLAVAGGSEVAAAIAEAARDYPLVLATQDWHHDPGAHFSEQPDYIDSWPAHCVAGTPGAQLHPALGQVAFQAVFRKGEYAAAYSGFEGATADTGAAGTGADDAGTDDTGAHDTGAAGTPGPSAQPGLTRPRVGQARTALAPWLCERGVTSLDVVGIATDHCVRATALDAVAEGFVTRVLLDLTAGVARESTQRALAQLRAAGVALVGEPVVIG